MTPGNHGETTVPIPENLSRAEKLRMMEALWDDLTHEAPLASPAWHAEALQATEAAVAEGKTSFIDWEAAKQYLREGRQ